MLFLHFKCISLFCIFTSFLVITWCGNVLSKIVPDSWRKYFVIHIAYLMHNFLEESGVVGLGKGVMYLTSLGCPADIGLQLGKACYPCSR